LKELVTKYLEKDDIFHTEFLSTVIFTGPSTIEITAGANKFLHSLGTTRIELIDATKSTVVPPPGPYFASDQGLLEIWRLYDDSQELKIGGNGIQTIAIAVPSRLKDPKARGNRLAGWRVAVKDIFTIQGLKTSVCNRAYFELYPPALHTAGCIKLLEDEGAYVLGTTKLASFAATEEPIECVDYQAPWNPRADGHQSPAGSSSGSGVAIASYLWLDISIGSDSNGSGRRPGHWNGCFAMRPSHGVLPVDGYIPSFEQFDMPTYFTRDIEMGRKFAEVWYGDNLPCGRQALPPSIIYPTDYMSLISNADQLKLIDQFAADLESSLGVTLQKISFDDLWDADPPREAGATSLQQYMKDASRNSFFYDDYHNFDNFREDYQREFSKAPYVSPPVRWQWELAASISKAERDVAVNRLAVYRKWFSEKVLKESTHDTVVIIPIENMSARYRDEPLGYFNPVAVPMLFVAPILKAPELTVPVGQVPFRSKVTGRIEHLPVAISLLASPG
ncbi:hypothetical protein OIDMADRAFT_124456, partial [Oidiodendron maius Zn]